MTQEFDESVVIRKGLASPGGVKRDDAAGGLVGGRAIARDGGWRDERISRETHDAGDSMPTSVSGA